MNIGSFDRGGRNRVPTVTDDHDFHPKTSVTPYGIFLPELDELFLYLTESKVTSDFIVDVLEDFWKSESGRFSQVKTLLINQDNGGENNSRRTQFMKRIVEFAQKYKLKSVKSQLNPGYLQEREHLFANTDNSELLTGFLNNGYRLNLSYSNLSLRGMSGGPVLDVIGQVIGINGGCDLKKILDSFGRRSWTNYKLKYR